MTMVTTLRARKKQQTRETILATGIRLIGERGLDDLTVDEIAATAGVGKGTIYNYFPTKEAIVVAFLIEVERRVQASLSRIENAEGTLDSILTKFLKRQFRLKQPYYRFVRVFLGQTFDRTDQMYPYIAELQDVIDPPLVHLFTTLQQRKLLRAGLEMSVLVHHFKTLHLGLTCTWAIEGPPFRNSARLLPQQVRLFCDGLKEGS